MKKRWNYLLVLLFLSFSIFFCQYFIYYVSLYNCKWPDVSDKNSSSNNFTKIMFLSDVHIIGVRKGEILDRLLHEWQMHRSFHTALHLFEPEYVFILGDIIDEGEYATDQDYQSYIARYKTIFLGNKDATDITNLPNGAKLYSIVGNHDIGFHYSLRPFYKNRFEKTFKTNAVDLININGMNFVTVNSVTMEGDYCSMCSETEEKLHKVAEKLCTNNTCDRPILLTHFPLFRQSDKNCHEPDSMPDSIKDEEFKPKWDCLSENATNLLFQLLNPRLILNGHTHFGCVTFHKKNAQEWTVASFNWRNIHRPTFLLVQISKDKYAIQKCYLPNEILVYVIYLVTIFLILITFSQSFIKIIRKKSINFT